MKNIFKLAILALGSLSILPGQNTQVKTDVDIRNMLLQTMQEIKSVQPEQKIFVTLTAALEKSPSPLDAKLEPGFNPLSSIWMNNGPKMFRSIATKNTLLLPENFFQMQRCSQAMTIEVYDLMFAFQQQLAGNPEMLQSVVEITDPEINPDPADKDRERIAQAVQLLEKFIYSRMQEIGGIVFNSCTLSEIRGMFSLAINDKEEWLTAVKDRVHQEITLIHIELGQ